MKYPLSKKETKEKIDSFFENLEDKSAKEVKKIKRLAMNKNISLKEKRKLFCRKCFTIYKNPKIRIRNKVKSVKCENCGAISRWKL